MQTRVVISGIYTKMDDALNKIDPWQKNFTEKHAI